MIPPFSDWPTKLMHHIKQKVYFLNGGFEFDGKVITELNEKEIEETA